jgi:peptidoglycan/LPS O-acetylase OafA/YrhL
VLTPLVLAMTTQNWWLAKSTALSLPWSVFMLPRPTSDPVAWFSINPPAWSLFYEMIGNILYGLLISRLSNRTLMCIVAVAAVVLTAMSLHYGTINAHPNWQIWSLTCLARMSFSFGLGLLFYRWWREGMLPAPKLPAGLAILLFLTLIAIPASGVAAGALTAAVVLVGFPLVVIIGIANEPSPRAAPAMFELGRMSYALYVLHWPIMMALVTLAPGLGVSPWMVSVLTVLISLAAAWYAVRWFDEPVRAWLARGTTRRPRAAGGGQGSATTVGLPR